MVFNIPPRYVPKEVEEKWYQFWEENNLFHAEINPRKKPYCIVIPPPNITGILHMGHALNNTVQDILIRLRRMQGYCTLWMPGTDHAGIATQNVVEKEIAREGLKRQDLGREKFLERTWLWREKYGSTIITQLKKLGCSCDWQRTRFTMDEEYSVAVSEVFIQLAQKDLIYKANYIINWCPRCQTALSDEESQHKEVKGNLYYIRYPLKKSATGKSAGYGLSDTIDYVVVATTRPETMLGDTAVAVNPKDKRYKKLIGKTVVLPLVNEEIPVVADASVDPKFGTGIVKVTPAHDPNDFEIARRHSLWARVVMNPDATMNQNAPLDYQQMDRFEAREAILEDLQERGLLEKTAPHLHSVGHCYRCHTMVEPYLSEQWFVDMRKLGKPAEEVVKKGKIRFYPARWKKVYLNWMEALRSWCISRQVWWGHRIPAWYCVDCKKGYEASRKGKRVSPSEKINLSEAGIMVSLENPKFCPRCGGTNIRQDEDVLDTWFSSWLWPFATFGWPALDKKQEAELAYFYPTQVLVTAQEIIFFWVARMIMAGMYFKKEVPFSDVYIHGTVRDITGTKMSKSLGNIIDPLEIISQYGCDALRFSIISLVATGQDVNLAREKFESGRNFANKIWNAGRFILTNLDREKVSVDLCIAASSITELKEKWILSRFYQTLGNVTKSLDNFRFNDAAKSIYEFFWHQFCDWYIELAKKTISTNETQVVLYKVLEKTLRMLHPVMPFITEELWQNLPHQEKSIMVSSWPHLQKQFIDKRVEQQMQTIISCITAIRNIRSIWQIDPAKRIETKICVAKPALEKLLTSQASYIKDLARIETLEIFRKIKRPKSSAVAVLSDIEIFIPLEGIIDVGKEAGRLSQKLKDLEGILQKTEKKLKNKHFLNRAPKEIVAGEKEKKEQLKESIKRLKDNLKGFK
ncbi:MAG: valine--tRNA ligase [Candidatus Omnitrophica bacterium]|nr:valine--tRNA ligase [Candidatus Omnitrophota bacterium]